MTYRFVDLFVENLLIESNPQSHAFPVDQPPERTEGSNFSVNRRIFQYTHPVPLEKWLPDEYTLLWNGSGLRQQG